MQFTGTVTGGKLAAATARQVGKAIAQFDGRRVRIALEEAPRQTRPNKRRYYFAAVVRNVCLALRDAGNVVDEEETHVLLKRDVGKLRKAVVLPDGEVTFTLRSYRDLTPTEETNYLQACLAWCAEMGIGVPTPENYHNRGEDQ